MSQGVAEGPRARALWGRQFVRGGILSWYHIKFGSCNHLFLDYVLSVNIVSRARIFPAVCPQQEKESGPRRYQFVCSPRVIALSKQICACVRHTSSFAHFSHCPYMSSLVPGSCLSRGLSHLTDSYLQLCLVAQHVVQQFPLQKYRYACLSHCVCLSPV